MRIAAVLMFAAEAGSAPACAQYPLTPSPALNFLTLSDSAIPSGYVAARQTAINDKNIFSISRARLTVQTQPGSIAAVRLQADFATIDSSTGRFTPSFALTDAYVQLSPPESSVTYQRWMPALIIGQFKTPFSLEFLTSYNLLLTANRSQASDSLAPRRDLGVMGHIQGWDRLILAASVTNGQGSNDPADTTGRQMVIGRITVLPIRNSLAMAAKWLVDGGDRRWGADFRLFTNPSLLTGTVIVDGEAIRRTGAVVPGTMTTSGSGGYLTALWRPLSWLEPVLKWEQMHESHFFPHAPTIGVERSLTWMTYGAILRSQGPTEHLRCQVNYIVKREKPVHQGSVFLTQVIVTF